MKTVFVSLFVAALCGMRLHAAPGAVLTLDGREFKGDLQFTNGALIVSSASGNTIIGASNIARAQFSTNIIAAQSKGSGNGLLGVYFNNTNLAGLAFTRLDETVDFMWPRSPLFGIPANNFSVRWMGYLQAPTTDAYTIYFGSDDGGRVYLDGQLIMDRWARYDFDEANATIHFKAGERRKLVIEYLEFTDNARAHLSWSTPSMPKAIVPQHRLYAASFDEEHRGDASELAGMQGLLATYYNNDDFTSNSFSRIDPEIDFQWKGEAPLPGFSPRDFSVRWSGNVLVTNSGDYRFWILCGAPLNLYINDQMLSFPSMLALQQMVPAQLRIAERCELRLEMRITNNVVPVKLFWSGPGFERTPLLRHHVSPAISPSRGAPPAYGPVIPAGIVLASGAIIDAPIQSASANFVRLGGVMEKQSLSTAKIARIHMKPVTAEMSAAIPKGRAGVLLRNRDFIDGDLGGVDEGRLKIESVLFGNRTFDLAKEVLVVVLRGNEPEPWHYSVLAQDGTIFYGKMLRLDSQRVGLAEAADIWLPSAKVTEITRQE